MIINGKNVAEDIWQSADSLSDVMNTSDYKNYLLGLVFYNYLSVKALKSFAKSNRMDDTGHAELKKQYIKFLDPDNKVADISTRDATMTTLLNKNGFFIEPEYLFSSQIEKINNGAFELQQLKDALHEIELSASNQNSNREFENIFEDIDLDSNMLGATFAQRNRVISETLLSLNSINLFDVDEDVLADAYEYLIAEFASEADKKSGEFYTPHQVSDIISRVVSDKGNDGNSQIRSVYDPTAGSASLLLNVARKADQSDLIKYYGQEINPSNYNLARMNLMIHGVSYEDIEFRNGDTLDKDWPDEGTTQFDRVVMNPPYSARWDNDESRIRDPRFKFYGVLPPKSKADLAFVLHGLYHLKEDGTMVVVLPHGVLFRGAKEGKIRKQLIKENKIDAVIGLPANIFHSTSIPTSILIFKQDKDNSDVMFIDASDEFEKARNENIITDDNVDKIVNAYVNRKDVQGFAHVASLEEIEENEFNLNIPRYVDTYVPEKRPSTTELLDENKAIQDQIDANNQKMKALIKDSDDQASIIINKLIK
ncbi:Type I restriction modification system protein [Apilactobacillus kunkeei]|nr:Type I restriction modification system protein [Apilactobacillus kunkeei]